MRLVLALALCCSLAVPAMAKPIIPKPVHLFNEQNEKVGEVKKMVLDLSGNVESVVVDIGAFIGAGTHDVIIPLQRIRLSEKSDRLVIAANKNELESLPELKY